MIRALPSDSRTSAQETSSAPLLDSHWHRSGSSVASPRRCAPNGPSGLSFQDHFAPRSAPARVPALAVPIIARHVRCRGPNAASPLASRAPSERNPIPTQHVGAAMARAASNVPPSILEVLRASPPEPGSTCTRVQLGRVPPPRSQPGRLPASGSCACPAKPWLRAKQEGRRGGPDPSRAPRHAGQEDLRLPHGLRGRTGRGMAQPSRGCGQPFRRHKPCESLHRRRRHVPGAQREGRGSDQAARDGVAAARLPRPDEPR